MTHLIINLIAFALSAFAFVLAVVAKRGLARQNKELLGRLNLLQEELKTVQIAKDRYYKSRDEALRFKSLCLDYTTTSYKFYCVNTEDGCMVIKARENEKIFCIIKEFTDPDQDYNRLCAEELVEKLNEK